MIQTHRILYSREAAKTHEWSGYDYRIKLYGKIRELRQEPHMEWGRLDCRRCLQARRHSEVEN